MGLELICNISVKGGAGAHGLSPVYRCQTTGQKALPEPGKTGKRHTETLQSVWIRSRVKELVIGA